MPKENTPPTEQKSNDIQLEGGTYEIIRSRLLAQGKELKARLDKLNSARKEVFGSIETKLLATERISTDNNCLPQDILALGDRFIFGYNVHMGLRSTIDLRDVFAIYEYADHQFSAKPLDLIGDESFAIDFQNLYKYYKDTRFKKFSIIGPHLFMVFQIGKSVTDIKVFKWLIEEDKLVYIDNRSEHEFRYPDQHEFQWKRTYRELHREGIHPHISIEDRLFVETVGGDLTIKVEDNTESGEGIYKEDVLDKDQTLDDAEIFYASLGSLIILKILPYKEKQYRYIVYNEKVKQARRIDAIEDSCILLPDGHGLIFSSGFYLQNGEFKKFEHQLTNMLFERRIQAPNGEDFLYVFYNREIGVYVLLSYNLIEQRVDIPIICNGYAYFDDGELLYFKRPESPQKHHVVQIWQTPYVGPEYQPETVPDSYLFKIGNKDIVRGMAECTEIYNLLHKDDTFAGLYIDLVKKTGDCVDAYFWLGDEQTFNLREVLLQIKETASQAVDEFEKVSRIRKNTKDEFNRVNKSTADLLRDIKHSSFKRIDQFVNALAELRAVRGEIIALKDLRYVELDAVEKLEKEVTDNTERVSGATVNFLLKPEALNPYNDKVTEQIEAIASLDKGAEAKKLGENIDKVGGELELLIDIVSNLKIDDPTKTTQIIDSISEIYTQLNQARASLRKRQKELLGTEAVAEFNSQLKLLNQGVINYLDVCDTPEKCDDYLTKLMIQVEELEGKFADFDEFIGQLTEKREEIYNAFESRKLSLIEARNKRANALQSSADRILKGIQNRAGSFDTVTDINAYFAADLMIDKVRDIVRQLTDLGDSVKAGDVQTRLKTIQEDSVRQLKDRQELFVAGEDVIKFGDHHFAVNTQPLDVTTVLKDGRMCFHLTGTNFFEPITDPDFLATQAVWDQEFISENRDVYRAEWLAYLVLKGALAGKGTR